MSKAPWAPRQAWISRPGVGGVPIVQHGLRTRVDTRVGGEVEIVLTNVTRLSTTGEVSLWLTSEDRMKLIRALGGEPITRWSKQSDATVDETAFDLDEDRFGAQT